MRKNFWGIGVEEEVVLVIVSRWQKGMKEEKMRRWERDGNFRPMCVS